MTADGSKFNIQEIHDFIKIAKIVEKRLWKKANSFLDARNDLLDKLPVCDKLNKEKLDSTQKLSLTKKIYTFFHSLSLWAHKCSGLRFFANIIKNKLLNKIIDFAYSIMEMVFAGPAVKIIKLIVSTILVTKSVINAVKAWKSGQHKDSSKI